MNSCLETLHFVSISLQMSGNLSKERSQTSINLLHSKSYSIFFKHISSSFPLISLEKRLPETEEIPSNRGERGTNSALQSKTHTN